MQKENRSKEEKYLMLRAQVEQRQQKLRTRSAAMHHRLKSEYLKSGVNMRRKNTLVNEKQLDAEIMENFVEDVEGETDEFYDNAEAYEHIPRMVKVYRTDTIDDGNGNWEEDAEQLCQFMDKLDISRFVDEVENVWQNDINDGEVQRNNPETRCVRREVLQNHTNNRQTAGETAERSGTHRLVRPLAVRRFSAIPVSYMDRPSNYIPYKLLTRHEQPMMKNEQNCRKRRVLSGILKSNQVS